MSFYFFPITGVLITSSLLSNPEASNEVLTVCPGDLISITCSHNNTAVGITRWRVSQTNSSADCNVAVSHGAPMDTACGLSNITMNSGSTPPFKSTFQARATKQLNGALVQCFSSGRSDSQVGSFSILISKKT